MNKYKVIWEERYSIVIEAKNKEEAEELVGSGEFSETPQCEEITSQPEAFEIEE